MSLTLPERQVFTRGGSFHYDGFVMYWLRSRGYKKNSCSTQLSTKFILLINLKMPTIVGILTFISKINTSEKQETSSFVGIFFYEQLKIRAQLS